MKSNNTFWKNRRVLVTGHTGFKGSWLCLWLIQLGAEVSGVALRPETKPSLFEQLQLESLMHSHHIVDIENSNELQKVIRNVKPEIIFHLAAQPLVRESYLKPLRTWRTNVIGSLNVLEALRNLKSNCSVIIVTTDKVYQNKEWTYGYLSLIHI